VNNAGLQDRLALLDGTAAEWDRMNVVNGRGPCLMTREIARAMVVAGAGGRIVNIASTSLTGQMIRGLAAYIGSKGALLALSRASAMELAGHAITVNTVLPGGVGTPGAIGAKGPAAEGSGRRVPPARHVQAARHRRRRAVLRNARRALCHQSGDRGGCRLLRDLIPHAAVRTRFTDGAWQRPPPRRTGRAGDG